MKFIRLALLNLPATIEEAELEFPLTIGNVGIELMLEKKTEEHLKLLIAVIAEADGKLSINQDRYLVIEKGLLDSCHLAIETVANLIAVSQHCKRRVSSPHPTCAIYPERQEESEFLNSSKGMLASSRGSVGSDYTFTLKDMDLNLLADRVDGLALLAETISHEHATGQFHELMRFFERGFACSGEGLYKPLLRFLSGSNLNYSKKEVLYWCKSLRNPVTHADKKDFLLEMDVIPSISRMELAAYDVLLNKTAWRDASPDRRDVWRAQCGPNDAEFGMFITKGKAAKINFRIFDSLGVYPLDLGGSLTATPDGWYTRFSNEEKQDRAS